MKKQEDKVQCTKYTKQLCKGCYHGKPHTEVVTEDRAFSFGYCSHPCFMSPSAKCEKVST